MAGFEEAYFIELKPDRLNDPTRTDLSSTPERWMEDVRRELRKIEARRVGKLLLNAIRFHQRWVRIGPHYPYVGDTHCGPLAAVDLINSGGRRYGSWVGFSPEKFAAGTACAEKRKRKGTAVADLHEMLFHELLHSFRHVSYIEPITAIPRRSGGCRKASCRPCGTGSATTRWACCRG